MVAGAAGQQVAARHEALMVMPGLCARSCTAAVGQAAAPEEGGDLAVLQRSRRFRDTQPLPRQVAIRIEPGCPEHPQRDDLVPLPGDPVETVLPRRSATDRIPESADVTRCV